jgi:hypothetical protein
MEPQSFKAEGQGEAAENVAPLQADSFCISKVTLNRSCSLTI